ncbi:unnamed protein product, partial [Ectocarpus fasciculatus]
RQLATRPREDGALLFPQDRSPMASVKDTILWGTFPVKSPPGFCTYFCFHRRGGSQNVQNKEGYSPYGYGHFPGFRTPVQTKNHVCVFSELIAGRNAVSTGSCDGNRPQ